MEHNAKRLIEFEECLMVMQPMRLRMVNEVIYIFASIRSSTTFLPTIEAKYKPMLFYRNLLIYFFSTSMGLLGQTKRRRITNFESSIRIIVSGIV
jgi:hypothetical protein